ncbi:MAG: hypothetical protein GIW95_06380 [Candidatus Eremiobacteraeota bacterium]|nr:hypothetical protein [Candidatus Eremiobacteraeota bacterium]
MFEIAIAFGSFVAVVGAWMVLPASPRFVHALHQPPSAKRVSGAPVTVAA